MKSQRTERYIVGDERISDHEYNVTFRWRPFTRGGISGAVKFSFTPTRKEKVEGFRIAGRLFTRMVAKTKKLKMNWDTTVYVHKNFIPFTDSAKGESKRAWDERREVIYAVVSPCLTMYEARTKAEQAAWEAYAKEG